MSSKKLLIVSLIAILVIACTQKTDKQVQAEQIVTEWVGKTLHFSKDIPLTVYGKDTVLPDFNATPYKILLYVDSIGCTSCKLKLFEWQKLIAEADTLLADKLSFVFYFQPKNKEELVYLFRRDRFNYPVYIDHGNTLMKLNKLPEDATFQCFLFDANNKVLSIGNPALNPGVWKLYKKIITGQISADSKNTTVEQIQDEIELHDIKKGETRKLQLRLKNTGNTALVITDIKTSCGCTTANWQKSPVEPRKITAINAEINIKEEGFFQKTVSVYCNTTNSPVIFTIKGSTK
jgi:hypothetical protein